MSSCCVEKVNASRAIDSNLSSSSVGDDEDESIILVSEEEDGRDPLWTLVNKVAMPSVRSAEPVGKFGIKPTLFSITTGGYSAED